MKNPVWLMPCSILCLTAGIFLMLVYFWADFAPQLHENMFRRGVAPIIPFVAGINIVAPIFLLWYCVKMDARITAGECEEDDL